jgi:hypothetical protein
MKRYVFYPCLFWLVVLRFRLLPRLWVRFVWRVRCHFRRFSVAVLVLEFVFVVFMVVVYIYVFLNV